MQANKTGSEISNPKVSDFIIGFVGWIAINGVLFFAIPSLGGSLLGPGAIICVFFPLPLLFINIVVLIMLFQKRRWIATGALIAGLGPMGYLIYYMLSPHAFGY